MKLRAIVVMSSLLLAVTSGHALAGGASSATAGPSGVGGATGSADGDSTGRLGRINQHSVKSYTMMRQLIAASGMKVDAAPVAGR